MVWSLALIFLSTVLPLKAFLYSIKFTGLPYLIQWEGNLKTNMLRWHRVKEIDLEDDSKGAMLKCV